MSRGFTWQKAIDRALQAKIRQAKRMAKGQINSDFDRLHPAEVREYATNKRFTQLEKRIKEEHEKELKQALARREAIGKGKR